MTPARRYNPKEHCIRDDVEFTITDDSHSYCYSPNKKDLRRHFDYVGDVLQNLAYFAKHDNADDIQTTVTNTQRKLGYVFSNVYVDDVERRTREFTPSEFLSHFYWYPESHKIPARTITVSKTKDYVILTYEKGFKSDDEIIYLPSEEASERKCDRVRACGKGIDSIHAPYKPSFAEKWRYRPSSVSLSYEQGDDGLILGFSSKRPDKPIWYNTHKSIFPMAGPYAYDTFDMKNQTSVVKFVSNSVD